MKKKIFKLLLVFVLLFLVGVRNVHAETYFRFVRTQSIKDLKSSGLITHNWYADGRSDHVFCAGVNQLHSCKFVHTTWGLYSAQEDSKYYVLYCLNLSLSHDEDAVLNLNNGLDSINWEDDLTQDQKNQRMDLLKRLLLYGYVVDSENTKSLNTIINNDPKVQLQLIAMQILVWEVMEGSRTTLDTEAPNVWNDTNSFYNQVVYPNGGSDPTKIDTIYYYYQLFRENARLGENATSAPAFDTSSYTLTWNSSKNRYEREIAGIGKYNKCESSDSNVVPTVSGDTVTIVSSKAVKNATITCRYIRGTGASDLSKEEDFRFYRFNGTPGSLQDMIYGTGYKIYKKSFNVSSENTSLKIKKVDVAGESVSGAKFTLTHMTNQSYSKSVDGNGSAVDLIYSGNYRVSETTVPKGYDKIKDFNITINGDTHKVTSCDNQGTNNGNMTCLNNLVEITYNKGTIELNITNVGKNFKILKINKQGKGISGATFEIRNSKNKLVTFSRDSGNLFNYDTKGTITSLNYNSHSYLISLLPADEYRIIETSVPYPYRLPADEEARTTKIKINSNRNLFVYNKTSKSYEESGNATVIISNYTTSFTVHKVGYGNPLEDVQFELYNGDKTEQIKCNMTSAGVYDYVDDQSTVENYVYITNSEGNITINNLPEGTYWIKEVYTIPPYVLPSGDSVYTKITIGISEKGVSINNSYNQNTIEISNTPNSFNFYKRDTEGNALTTGKYKLQKYDKESNKYVDLKLVEVPNDGTYNPNTVIYKVDKEKGKIQFTLTKGVATFIDMDSSSTYRIIETVAPNGYTKASTKDTATVQIDEYGNASGLLVLIDQKIVKDDDSAYAELIINIQTGKQRIMYAAIIVIVIGIIAGLILYNKRK